MSEFVLSDWKTQLRAATASDWKEIIYKFLRPLLNGLARRHLSKETLSKFQPDLVLGSRGMPLNTRRRWAIEGTSLAGKTLLVQGTGNGWDLVSWAPFGPAKMIGVDLFEFKSWSEIENLIEKEFGIDTKFHVSSLNDLSFLQDESIDICASDAVFEHVKNLDSVLKETYRILKPNGIVYAIYGPLWYCAGGDHFSGRGGLKNVFNHVLLENIDYKNYLYGMRNEKENFQSGLRYVEMDMFSKLRTEEYLRLFRNSGFIVDSLIIELCKKAIMFKRVHDDLFQQLIEKNHGCTADDFIIKANFVRLKKQNT